MTRLLLLALGGALLLAACGNDDASPAVSRSPSGGLTETPASPAAVSPTPAAGAPQVTPASSPAAAPGTPAQPTPAPATTQPAPGDPVLVGAGDIASCYSDGDEATAALLDAIPGTVFTAGDNAYQAGSAADFGGCYEPSWGRHKARTRPSPGNHDYATDGAYGYYSYFGDLAGPAGRGYYSYDLGAWHIIALNSNCWAVSCDAGSEQEQWLRADLAAHPAACTLAYWHHPRFSSGLHGGDSTLQPFWQALYDYGTDIVISGHDHDYERFAPQAPDGRADPNNGIREFIVGTGGASHYGFGSVASNSEVRDSSTFGVLKLTLHPTSYDWQFVPVAGEAFTDSGSEAC